jgi:hypothetical protein
MLDRGNPSIRLPQQILVRISIHFCLFPPRLYFNLLLSLSCLLSFVNHISGDSGRYLGDESFIRRNKAFLYFKPESNTYAAIGFVRDWLSSSGFIITEEGDISSAAIDKGALVDKQYPSMSQAALQLKPSDLTLSAHSLIAFQKTFGRSWSTVLSDSSLVNAVDACALLDVSSTQLCEAWMKAVSKGMWLKIKRGVSCALIDSIPYKQPIICINGFFPEMRARYSAPMTNLHYFAVEWEDMLMTWESFCCKVIGSTDPSLSAHKSLRYQLFTMWRSLALPTQPSLLQNCLHASNSAFEAMLERCNWLNIPLENDPLAKRLISAGVSWKLLREWSTNPIIRGKSIFEHFLGKGTLDTVDIAVELSGNDHGELIHPPAIVLSSLLSL